MGHRAVVIRVVRTWATMATTEQVQEALQRLQAQEARIAALEAQLQIESARAQTAEQERSALIQTLVPIHQDRAGGMVKSKRKRQEGVCYSGKRETKTKTT